MVEIRAMRNSFVAEVSDQLSGVFVDQIPRIANKLPVRGDDPLSSGIAFQRDFGIVLEDLCKLFAFTKNPRGVRRCSQLDDSKSRVHSADVPEASGR